MEPWGIEPQCRISQLGASTSVCGDLISVWESAATGIRPDPAHRVVSSARLEATRADQPDVFRSPPYRA